LRGQTLRQVEPRHPDAVVGHPVVDVEAVRFAEIVSPVDSRGKDDLGDGPATLLR